MEIRLLGAPHLLWQGQSWTLRRRQVRALFYRLAAEPAPVSRSHLAFLFWPDAADAQARRQLTRLLTALRAALPDPQLLLVDEETATLDQARVSVDCHSFATSAEVNETATLASAAALYGGEFLAGFELPDAPEYAAWQAATARRFAEKHLALLGKLVERYTAADDYPAAIAYAQRYLVADELAEPMHRRLIALYTASGDRAAAQRQLEQCTLVLERELGVSPMPETRDALRAIWRPTAAPEPVIAPEFDLPLTGRDELMARLLRVCEHLARSRSGLVLIGGEMGMGKSRLLRELAARWRGMVLTGACHSEHMPYAPLLQMLRATLADRDLWATVPAHWRSELLPLLPELRGMFTDLSVPVAPPTTLAQQHLYAAIVHALSAFAGQAVLLLCLDDLHLADDATLGWLDWLAANADNRTPIVVAATAATSTPALDALRRKWLRARRFADVTVEPLELDAAIGLFSCLPQTPALDLTARIHAVAGGNPFFMLEIMRDLLKHEHLSNPPPELPLPASVREAIQARITHLRPLARQLLEAAAILDPHLAEELLQSTAARTPEETADALDELVAHQFLRLPKSDSTFASPELSHALLRMTVLAGLTPWRRKLLHRRAAEALQRLRPNDAATLAHHFTAAEQWETAIAYEQQAAVQARDQYAFGVALAHLERAFLLLTHTPQSTGLTIELLRQRLALRRILVQIPAWQADIDQLLQLAGLMHDEHARLDALEAQISLHVLQSELAAVEESAMQALALAERLGDRRAAARIHQTLGWHLADALGRSRAGLTHLEIACRLAQAAGDRQTHYQALCNLAFAQRAEGQCMAARASAQQALSLTAYHPGDPPHPACADALRELGEANAYLGRWEEARSLLRPLLELYRTLDDPWAYGTLLYNYGLYSSNMGQHADAIDAMRRLVGLSQAVGLPADSEYGIWHRAGLARVLLAAGAVIEASALLNSLDVTKLSPGRPYLAWAKAAAELRLATDDAAAALAIVQPAAAWWRAYATPHDADVLLLLAQVAWESGDAALARSAVAEAGAHLAATDLRRYHVRLHAMRYRVTGDPAALAAACTELDAHAAHFSDPSLRDAFMQEVALHRWIRTQ
ncbi:MAG TPA: AAA family ATPase [Chloroflexi bacterium]|nr:AAA family ATPase [Chloroflexota bacterium]